MIFAEVIEHRASVVENAWKLSNPGLYMGENFLQGGQASTGALVTDDTARAVTAIFASILVKAGTLATVPLPLYKKLSGGGRKKAEDHHLYSILHDQPNPEMSSAEWRYAMQGWKELRGNCASEIEWGNDGEVKALWPLSWDRIAVRRINGAVWYEIYLPDGNTKLLPRYRVFHIRGLSNNGLVGLSPIEVARDSIGMSIAMDEYAARFYANDATPGGFLEHPGPKKLSDAAKKNLENSFKNEHQGLSKKHRLHILEEGMKWHQSGIDPEKTQLVEQREYQIREACRIHNMKPHMIADLKDATFSNIEHQGIEFITHTMRPEFVLWEQAITCQLILPAERSTYFAKFNADALYRGDIKTRYEAHAIAIQNGMKSADEIRETEEMNPIPDDLGKKYYMPVNMQLVEKMGEAPEPVPIPEDKPDAEPEDEPEEDGRSDSRMKWEALAEPYVRLFADAMGRVIRREKADVSRTAMKIEDAANFIAWCEKFYESHADFVRKNIEPVVFSFVEVVQAVEAENSVEDFTPQIQRLAHDYSIAFAQAHAQSGLSDTKTAVASSENIVDALDKMFEKKVKTLPGKIAKTETNKIGRAAAKLIRGEA